MRHLALLSVAGLALTGCGGGQATPRQSLETFYKHIAQQQFNEACKIVDPALISAAERWGTSCAAALASQYRGEDVSNLTIDEALIQVSGDVARVRSGAVTWPGKEAQDDDVDALVQKDGRWFVRLG